MPDETEVPTQGAEPLDIARLMALCEAATRGPWEMIPMESLCCEVVVYEADGEPWFICRANSLEEGEFIAAARAALPIALRELAAAKQERDNSLSSDFAAVWHAYVDVPDSELTADAVALKDRLIAAVQDSPWFSDYEHAHDKLSEVMRIEGERDDLKAQLEQARADGERAVSSLEAIMGMINGGLLVRDISRDHEPGWAMQQLPMVLALKGAQEVIDAARAQGGEGM